MAVDFKEFLEWADKNPQVNVPNMRFGTSFLGFDKHKRAVNDEVLMDKRTGQLVYKRDTDGKLIYYAQENFHLNNYIRQLKSLMARNKKDYIRPIPKNCEFCDDTFFVSYNIETIDFFFHEESTERRLIDGGVLLNPYPQEHSFTQETNGFFINLVGRPRDRAMTSFLTGVYDKYYKNYDGEDQTILDIKAMYDDYPTYFMSQAVVNYTVTYYTTDDNVYAQQTSDAFVRVNEVSFVPFVYAGIYPRSAVEYATIRINSISVPKLASAMNLLKEGTEEKLAEALLDNEDVSFISCNISIFMTTTDKNFTMPTDKNTIPMLLMQWEEFETELVNAKETGSYGVMVSVDEPDITDWEDLSMWMEPIRKVYTSGETDPTGAEHTMDELEKIFGMIEYYGTKFTMNVEETEHIFTDTLETIET